MPGFGDNPNTTEADQLADGMYSPEMLAAVATYEANLHDDGSANNLPGGATEAPFSYDMATTTTTAPSTTTTTKG
jgi:hypothetical protein